MKHITKIFWLIPVLFVFLFQSSLSSCTKNPENDTDTIVITKRDTIIKQDTFLTTAILAAQPWKVLEERGVSGGNLVYYYRGGSSNTQNFDNERVTFNANGTGTHKHNNGTIINMTWTFSNPEHTKLVWTVLNTPATYNITWDNIRYKNGNLYFDQYYTDGNTGIHSHSNQIRMPQ